MTHNTAAAFEHTSGPKDSKVVFVGEAHGETEALTGLPLMGASGQEFNTLLKDVGLERRNVFCTNVFAFRPPSNNIELLCCDKTEHKAVIGSQAQFLNPKHLIHTPLRMGKYFHPQYWPEVERLYDELNQVAPNLIVAMGNTACWALLGATRISAIRGAITTVARGASLGTKILPTYHPAALLRNWALRPIVIADFQKAVREMDFPEIRRMQRKLLVKPTIPEIIEWFRQPAYSWAVDIETKRRSIEMVSFARSPRDAIIIDFMDQTKPDWRYWPTFEEELKVWHIMKAALEGPIPKIFQNGLFDIQYFARMGIFPRSCKEDTMLLHHSHFPEMLKGLGFLGSIYTNEAAWKLMRLDESLKRDE